MGVIISLLLGGFAQDNIPVLMAGQDLTNTVRAQDGFSATLAALFMTNRYGALKPIIKPEVGLRKGIFSFSLGYLVSPFSPGGVIGIPITADASVRFQPFEHLFLRPRVSLLGPAHFFAEDAYESYHLYLTIGGGGDVIYDPFSQAKIKPVILLGATAGYTFGNLIVDIYPYEEPLEGFGAGGNAFLALLYNQNSWSIALQTGVSYGGHLIPQVSLSFLW
jgi:hypothetical protein